MSRGKLTAVLVIPNWGISDPFVAMNDGITMVELDSLGPKVRLRSSSPQTDSIDLNHSKVDRPAS